MSKDNSPSKIKEKETKPKEEAKKSEKKDEDKSVEKSKPKEKKRFENRKALVILIALLGFLFFCCLISALAIFFYEAVDDDFDEGVPLQDQVLSDPNSMDSGHYDHTSYVGYEEFELSIEDNEDFSNDLRDFSTELENMAQAEREMIEAAQLNDSDAYFEAYAAYNLAGSKLLEYSWLFDNYLYGSEDSDAFGSLLIQKAYAKERNSWWYYVPIIGSLMKAKHQSIETARAGVYDYLKNDLDSIDRQSFLDAYGLDSVEDLRDASDSKVEKLARDPELRAGIDWTEISTEIGKRAVIATVDSYKIASSRNPISPIATTSAFRIMSEKGGPVDEKMPLPDVRTTLLIDDGIKDAIDQQDSESHGKRWQDIPDSAKGTLVGVVDEILQDREELLVMSQGSDENGGTEVNVPPGTYEFLTATTSTVPIQISDVLIQDGNTVELLTINAGYDVYALDPEVALNLGFDASQVTTELEINSCSDLAGSSQLSDYEISTCDSNYKSCMENPLQFDDGYSACISAGGCWDIGRWEYVNESNCGIDADNNLDYENPYFDEDFEYFPGGNLAYCECVVECREEFTTKKDCSGELRNCCTAD